MIVHENMNLMSLIFEPEEWEEKEEDEQPEKLLYLVFSNEMEEYL